MKYFTFMNDFLSFRDWLKDEFRNWDIQYRLHATQRMYQRNFEEFDIFSCLDNGKIIEKYENDMPFPSVLINGRSISNRPIHVIVGIDIKLKRLYIITVYEPDPVKWKENFTRRLKI
jgi:hypothetical protein